MRAPRAILVALVSCWVAVGATPVAHAAQLGAVTVDRDGWWDRATDPARPLNSPGLPFPVPSNALAVSASGGEPDKVAAVGILLDVDPTLLQRLLLNLKEAADPGANAGTSVAAIQACAITASWSSAKKGAWTSRPGAETTGCAAGTRSADGGWSFDLTSTARRWLDGSLAPNGVLLVEKVDAPVTFQVAVGDRSTKDMSFSLDLTREDDSIASPTDTGGSSTSGDTSSTDTISGTDASAPVDSFQFSGSDSFTVPTPVESVPAAASPTVAAPASSRVQPTASLNPNTRGNLPLATLLLLPLGLGLAALLSLSMGSRGESIAGIAKREGGVSRALAKRSAQEV